MNLTTAPNIAELQAIFAQADDDVGHHILWVDVQGNVCLSVLPSHLSPVGFEAETTALKIRYETFDQGAGYVGPDAAADLAVMQPIFDSLVREWAHRRSGVQYVDNW